MNLYTELKELCLVHSVSGRERAIRELLTKKVTPYVDEVSEDEIYEGDENAPVWARSALSAMCTLGIYDDDDAFDSAASITRGDTAQYLYRMMNVGKNK